MDRNLVAGLFHASASLGIAESAAQTATTALAKREHDARTRTLVAENVIELGACRATLSRAATLVDDDDREPVVLFAEAQAAKTFVNETAARIVDRALSLSRRRRLPQRPPARARLPRRPGRQLHAAARRQPRLRPARRRRARPRARPALMAAACRHAGARPSTTAGCGTRSAASPTGVAFVTAEVDGTPLGLIVSTFAAVSLDPPLVSFCPARDSFTWRRMRQAGGFDGPRARRAARRLRAPRGGARRRPLRASRCTTRSR